MNMQPVFAWYYCAGEQISLVGRLGFLIPNHQEDIHPAERGMVWFSLNQHYEPTALFGIVDPKTGQTRRATVAEMMKIESGPIRYGVSPSRLLAGEEMRKRARISPKNWKAICQAGRDVGADPEMWLGTDDRIDIETCVVDLMNHETGEWERYEDPHGEGTDPTSHANATGGA